MVKTNPNITCSAPIFDKKSNRWIVERYNINKMDDKILHEFDNFLDAWRFHNTYKRGDSFIENVKAKMRKDG